jgi:hypothetical protein
VVSDLSGDVIEEGKAARIQISFDDGRRQFVEIDAAAEEAAELGRKVGRSPGEGASRRALLDFT